jgi:hypothetical protein
MGYRRENLLSQVTGSFVKMDIMLCCAFFTKHIIQLTFYQHPSIQRDPFLQDYYNFHLCLIFMVLCLALHYNQVMKTAYCTYCSKQKSDEEGDLPAIQRYRSQRIAQVSLQAMMDGCVFFILSGKYGLIGPDYPLPYYDHLLQPDEITGMTQRVAEQIRTNGVEEIQYFSNDPEHDSTLTPYQMVIEKSCQAACVQLNIVYFPGMVDD